MKNNRIKKLLKKVMQMNERARYKMWVKHCMTFESSKAKWIKIRLTINENSYSIKPF